MEDREGHLEGPRPLDLGRATEERLPPMFVKCASNNCEDRVSRHELKCYSCDPDQQRTDRCQAIREGVTCGMRKPAGGSQCYICSIGNTVSRQCSCGVVFNTLKDFGPGLCIVCRGGGNAARYTCSNGGCTNRTYRPEEHCLVCSDYTISRCLSCHKKTVNCYPLPIRQCRSCFVSRNGFE